LSSKMLLTPVPSPLFGCLPLVFVLTINFRPGKIKPSDTEVDGITSYFSRYGLVRVTLYS
jgi:hypothetical protein